MRPVPQQIVPDLTPLDVRVCGSDGEPLTDADLRRLFSGSGLTDVRLDRLRAWPRILVLCGTRIVGVATCLKVDEELRVPDIGIDGDREILNAILDAAELTGMAGGCTRIVLSPPKVSQFFLERRGYRRVDERCAGGWIEKRVG